MAEVAELVGARLVRGDPDAMIQGAAPLEAADAGDLSFLDNPKYVKHLATTRATACLCQKRYVDRVPDTVAVLETAEPYRAYSRYLAHGLSGGAAARRGFFGGDGAFAAPSIRTRGLRRGCAWSPAPSIGARAEIGRGTVIAAGAVIGEAVAIGRDCSSAPTPRSSTR